MSKVSLDTAIREFSAFLNASWNSAVPSLKGREYTTDESSISDWLQANWEVLVERRVLKINEYLEVYGSGADFYRASSRITDAQALPDYAVIVKTNTSDGKTYDVLNNRYIHFRSAKFVELVGFRDTFYHYLPMFDYALIKDVNNIERVVKLNDVLFELKPL